MEIIPLSWPLSLLVSDMVFVVWASRPVPALGHVPSQRKLRPRTSDQVEALASRTRILVNFVPLVPGCSRNEAAKGKAINVFRDGGKLHSLSNRRLFVFRVLRLDGFVWTPSSLIQKTHGVPDN